jgi:predicted MFS family arabinose efflux permease
MSARRRPASGPLRKPAFRLLAAAWVCINLADSALFLVVAVWMKELTGSDAAAAGVFAALGLPAVLAPVLGDIADRYSRRLLLIIACAAMLPVLGLLLLVNDPGDVWIVYGVMVAYGAIGYLIAGAQSGLVRDLLDDDELATGNGLLSTIDQAFRLLAPLAGTAAFVLVGPEIVILITAAAFVCAAVLLVALRVVESEPDPREGRYLSQIFAGFRHLRATPPLGALTIAIAVAFGATGFTNVLVFPLIDDILGLPAAALGVIVTIQGVGSVAGGATAARVIRALGERRTVAVGLLGLAASFGGMLACAMTPRPVGLALTAALSVAIGVTVPWILVAYVTLRQTLTPPRLQGRTGAASNMAINVPQTAAVMAGAALVAAVDFRLLVAIAGLTILVGAWVAGRGSTRPATDAPEPTSDVVQ